MHHRREILRFDAIGMTMLEVIRCLESTLQAILVTHCLLQ